MRIIRQHKFYAAAGTLIAMSNSARAADGFEVSPMSLGFAAFGLFGLGFALYQRSRAKKQDAILQTAKRKLGEVEYQLNEAETALQSESQVLLTWPAIADAPERMVGSLHGAAEVPETIESLMDFAGWLEKDSALRLSAEVAELHKSGSAFNFGIKTLQGDLLEADGRTAGTMATLRFRPLAGQRRETNETQYDAHKLAKQVERLSAILDSVPFPVWLANKKGELTWVNSAYVDQAENGNVDAIIRKNAHLAKPEAIDSSKAESKAHLIGRARVIKGGKPKALNIHEVVADEGKVGFAVDATALEDAERELDRHIKAHASTLDKLSTAISIFGPDQRLRFHNQAFQQLWQFNEKFLAGQPSDGEVLDALRAKRMLPEQASYREWRGKQLQAYTKIEPREDFWYLPDGRSLRVVSEQHPFGGVTYLYENLTKEYQLESRFNELNEVQRETLDNLAEAVALSGPDGRLRLYNPAFMRFWSFDEKFLSDKPHLNEFAGRQTLGHEAQNAWADIKFAVTGLEAKRKALEGRVEQEGRILRYRAVPLPDGNALLTFSDVSDAARAERALQDRAEALEATDRLKNQILANVSYEVRTPLASIVGFSEALDGGLKGSLNEGQAEYVGAIRKSAYELKEIIDAIIDLSAIDAGQMELKLAPVDVEQLLSTVIEKYAPQLAKRGMQCEAELGADVTTVMADAERLFQVLANLLSNAIGFSKIGSKIMLGARKKGGQLQIYVADQGRGIDPEFQSKVFDRFQAKPMPGNHRGPGLGLALVKSFVELHGGTVSLVSKLDKGTTVVCTLPLNGPSKAGRSHVMSSAA